jgi:hypothetical protein
MAARVCSVSQTNKQTNKHQSKHVLGVGLETTIKIFKKKLKLFGHESQQLIFRIQLLFCLRILIKSLSQPVTVNIGQQHGVYDSPATSPRLIGAPAAMTGSINLVQGLVSAIYN